MCLQKKIECKETLTDLSVVACLFTARGGRGGGGPTGNSNKEVDTGFWNVHVKKTLRKTVTSATTGVCFFWNISLPSDCGLGESWIFGIKDIKGASFDFGLYLSMITLLVPLISYRQKGQVFPLSDSYKAKISNNWWKGTDLPTCQTRCTEQMTARLDLDVLIPIIANFAQFKGSSHLTVEIVLLAGYFHPFCCWHFQKFVKFHVIWLSIGIQVTKKVGVLKRIVHWLTILLYFLRVKPVSRICFAEWFGISFHLELHSQ